jgi:transposase
MEEKKVEFEQVVSRGCGIDIHKKTAVATIAGEGLKRETREYLTYTSSLTELREWLLENKITHVSIESTGVYWKPVYNVLEGSGITVWLVNARHVKNVPGHKTDKKDSKWLCKLLLAGLLKPSYIPPKSQRELRALTRYRKKLIQQISSEKNRIIRMLEDCNIKLSCVLSDVHGVAGTKLVELLCTKQSVSRQDIDEVYHAKLQCSKSELYEACNGIFTSHNIYLLGIIKKNISNITKSIEDLNLRIKDMLAPYENVLELLKSIPGLSTKTVEDLVAEIGLDMEVFPSEKHLASWAGMAPGNNESAGKKKADAQLMATSKSKPQSQR